MNSPQRLKNTISIRVGIRCQYDHLEKVDISSKFTFKTGFGGTVIAYACAGIVQLTVTLSTIPTLSANASYEVFDALTDAVAQAKNNVFVDAHRASNYYDYGTPMLAMLPASNNGALRISTGSSVGSGNVRFSMTYVNNE